MSIDDQLIAELIEERDLDCSAEFFRAKTAIRKLAPMFPDDEYGDLWLSILGLAIVDVSEFAEGRRNSFFTVDAYKYLSQDEIPACELAGISSSYAKRVISSTIQVELG
jgi:hypothetical protein